MYLLHALLDPLRKANDALYNYLNKNQVPQLPQQYTDDAGRLMQQIQQLVEQHRATKAG